MFVLCCIPQSFLSVFALSVFLNYLCKWYAQCVTVCYMAHQFAYFVLGRERGWGARGGERGVSGEGGKNEAEVGGWERKERELKKREREE